MCTTPFKSVIASHQEDDWRTTDQGHRCGKLALVPAAVGSSWLVGIVDKAQLLDAPLSHLSNTANTVVKKSIPSFTTYACIYHNIVQIRQHKDPDWTETGHHITMIHRKLRVLLVDQNWAPSHCSYSIKDLALSLRAVVAASLLLF